MARNPFAAATDLQAGVWGSGGFQGADTSRLFFDWAVGSMHPDRDIRWSAKALRARARDLVRNNDYAAGVLDAFADNVIGSEGIRCKPVVRGPDGRPLREVNWEIERGWSRWSEPENASVDAQESWLEVQRLIVKTWVQDGEVFLRHREAWDNQHGYAVELIDADLLDESYNVPPDENGVEIRMGVEVDRYMRRRAYHFFRHHPSEGRGRERVRIPAREIEHYFVRNRPGQTRGYTLFAPALTTVKMIDGLTEAELVASRMAAATMGFISNMEPQAIAAYAERLRIANDQGTAAKPKKFEIAPGVVPELAPGQTFQGFDPNHPTDAFESFLKVMLRGVARNFSMSYLTFSGDVGEANYSSMRAGLIPERDHWRIVQTVFASRMHRPVYRRWIGNALLAGAVRLPTAAPADYYGVEWKPRGWKWVDPLKDLQAAELGIKIGVNSRTEIASDQGRDYESVVDELRDEQEYAEAEGVDVSVRKEASTPVPGGSDEQPPPAPRRNGAGHVNRLAPLQNGASHG